MNEYNIYIFHLLQYYGLSFSSTLCKEWRKLTIYAYNVFGEGREVEIWILYLATFIEKTTTFSSNQIQVNSINSERENTTFYASSNTKKPNGPTAVAWELGGADEVRLSLFM